MLLKSQNLFYTGGLCPLQWEGPGLHSAPGVGERVQARELQWP